jgi:hypothetical protein
LFDLAWLPSLFVPYQPVPDIVARVFMALKPGGWLLVPVLRPTNDLLATALSRLRVAMFGGWAWPSVELETLLCASGYRQVRTMASSPQALTALVVARKE